jgi:uncharacterized delta-60 repeat protein
MKAEVAQRGIDISTESLPTPGRRSWVGALTLVAALALESPRVSAAPGDLDPSFGNGGVVATFMSNNGSDKAHAIAADPGTSRVVVAGTATVGGWPSIAIARYSADGTLDTTFGDGGRVVDRGPGCFASEAYAVAVELNHKVVVAGSCGTMVPSQEFLIGRYNADGNLDVSFGTAGFVRTRFGPATRDMARALALDRETGKLVVAGYSRNDAAASPNQDFAVARYLSTGALDATFNSTGTAVTDLGAGKDDFATGVALYGQQVFVVGYGINPTNGSHDFAAVRYRSNGLVGGNFGTNGVARVDVSAGADDRAYAIARFPGTSKMVIAGESFSGQTLLDFAMIRLTASGKLDTGFNSTGKVITPVSGGHDGARGLAIQADGKIVVVGMAASNTSGTVDIAVRRYGSDGSIDAQFGSGGGVVTSVGTSVDEGEAVAMRSDGRIVVAGRVAAACPPDCSAQECEACFFGRAHCTPSDDFALLGYLAQ